MIVSLIVPIYNTEKYLGRCIDSILSQTYSNIEIILVNDGSQDSSLQICNDYSKLDNRIIVINQINAGLAGARNSGLEIAKGEYIAFIDADDAIDSITVSDFVNIATSSKPDVICSNFYAYEEGNIEYKIIRNELKYNHLLNKEEIKKYFLQPYYGGYMGIIPSACTKFYNIDFLNQNNLNFDIHLRRAQDYWFNFYVFKNAETVFVIDKSYYHYFKNEGSMIRTYRTDVFKMYLSNRRILIDENRELGLKINWPILNSRFNEDANEYILLCFKAKGFFNSYKVVNEIIKNKEFQNSYFNINPLKMHTKFIKKLLKFKMYFFIHIIYYVWSSRLN